MNRSNCLFAALIESAMPKDSIVVGLRHIYFDESGTHDGAPLMTLAGYMFKVGQAARFSRDWHRELNAIGIPFAHQTDCATGNGVYKNMSMEQRISAQTTLINHIQRRVLIGFSVTVDPSAYALKISADDLLPTAYSFLIVAAVHMAAHWANSVGFDGKFAYFFEAGHNDQAEANTIMNALSSHDVMKRDEYRYFSHSFVGKKDAPPLQAADMLAWQTYHYFDRKKNKGITKPGKDFVALVKPNRDLIFQISDDAIDEYRAAILSGREFSQNRDPLEPNGG